MKFFTFLTFKKNYIFYSGDEYLPGIGPDTAVYLYNPLSQSVQYNLR